MIEAESLDLRYYSVIYNPVSYTHLFSTAYNNYLINAWMGVTKPEQPQTLEEGIAHYEVDSRVVDANQDVFDFVMLRKEFTEDKQGNPTPEGQG